MKQSKAATNPIDYEDVIGCSQSNPFLVVLFIPTKDRKGLDLNDANQWLDAGIMLLTRLFGGATLVTSQGAWHDASTGNIVKEEVHLLHSYATSKAATNLDNFKQLANFLHRLGREADQGEIGLIIKDTFHRITEYRTTDLS
jgi:hypothetical protein